MRRCSDNSGEDVITKLRIAHTESSINMGGQEIRVLGQIGWLLDHGHSAWLLAREDSAIYAEGRRRGLPLCAIPFRGSVNPAAVMKVLAFVRRERIDLIDCHSSRDASTVVFARLIRVPVLRSQHICKPLKDDFFHRLVWSIGCDRIVVNSTSIANRIVNQNLGRRKIVDVIGTGVDLERFRPDVSGAPARETFGIPPDAKLITVVGMIRPDKAQRYLVRAVDRIVGQIPGAYFFVVGSPTKAEFLDRLKDEIRAIHHKERVILTGFQHSVEDFIAASDVIVLTSEIEARPQVIPQAFAMKKIVVATDVGGIPEYVRHGETGFLYTPGDVDKLAELVVNCLDGRLSAVTEKAYLLARETMGFEAMMTATLRTYRSLLGI